MKLIKTLYSKIEEANLWDDTFLIPKNEYLKTANTSNTNLYYIVSGSVRLYINDSNNEHTIRFGYQNNFITALDSFITEKPSPLYIQALKQTEVKRISKTNYLNFIKSSAELTIIWEQLLQQLILQQTEREIDILTNSPKERYFRVLKRSPQLFQEIPHKYIANYLRMSPETLSRIKKS